MLKKGSIFALLFICFNGLVSAHAKVSIYDENDGVTPIHQTSNYPEATAILNSVGIRFEKWEANKVLSEGASEADVMEAYRSDVDRLVQENGYQSVDIVRMFPQHPKKDDIRNKFFNEHTHTEDEVRFFVEGDGLFYMHVDDKVYIVLCEKGDLISIPAYTRHWFDMGSAPYFTAIRFFINSDGWVPQFTQNEIAQKFPTY